MIDVRDIPLKDFVDRGHRSLDDDLAALRHANEEE